jgi:hypothetical protein
MCGVLLNHSNQSYNPIIILNNQLYYTHYYKNANFTLAFLHLEKPVDVTNNYSNYKRRWKDNNVSPLLVYAFNLEEIIAIYMIARML